MRHGGAWGVAALWLGLAACDPYGDYCEARVDCLDGNEADIDACVEERSRDEDFASAYDCSAEWDDYSTCMDENADCTTIPNANYKIYSDCDAQHENCRCNDEEHDLEECIDDASDIYYEHIH